MLFSSTTDELVSTHGYSLNSIVVWKTKTMEKLTTLNGHTYRVLYLARSPDEECILTGSGDQTLRFWKLFPSEKNQYDHSGKLEMKNFMIRWGIDQRNIKLFRLLILIFIFLLSNTINKIFIFVLIESRFILNGTQNSK